MWLLRLLAVILVIAVGVGIVAYAFTGNKRYLAFAWRLFRYGIIFALFIFALMFVERLAIIPF
jgi:hypothetical protein